MKKTLLLLAVLCLAVPALAQDYTVCQPDSARIFFDTSSGWDYYGGVWDFSCSYTEKGLLSHMRLEAHEGESCLVRDHQYEYDQSNNMVCCNYVGYECESPWSNLTKEVCTYQGSLLVTQANYYLAHKSDRIGRQPWVCSDSTVFQYDGLSRLVAKKSYNSSLVHFATVRYEYDDHMITIITEQLSDGVWSVTLRVTKQYSDDSLLLSVLSETCDNGCYSNDTYETFSYDNHGRCTGVLTQQWDNGTWQNVKLVDNTYDGAGHLTVAEVKGWQDGAFDGIHRALYELNEEGYPAVVTFEQREGGVWVEGSWRPEFHVYAEDYLSRHNQELCNINVKRIELHYATTPMPGYDIDEHGTDMSPCNVHPNPTTGQVTVTGKALRQAEVFNTLGQCILTVTSEGDELHIDMNGKPAGIYFVTVTDAEGRKCVKKVVKE